VPGPIDHGGDLDAARRLNPDFAGRWLDLSTGINPEPYPLPALAPALWHRLPQAEDERAAMAAARVAYGVGSGADVVPAPGTQILIGLLPRLRSVGRVAILGPTYGEHAPVWRAAGHRVRIIADLSEVRPDDDTVVVVNPNNPDGRRCDPLALDLLRARLAQRGGLLVVDEAFADVTPDLSLAPIAGRDALVVLRSFGKFFGLAGLRLGFALCAPESGRQLRQALGPWAVGGPALGVGARALSDRAWIEDTRAALDRRMSDLRHVVLSIGLTPVGGTSLYLLCESDDAGQIFQRLIASGIYVRRFPAEPRWLRLGATTADGLRRLAEIASVPS